GLDELQPWDMPFYSERLRESRYDYSEDDIKQYFTEPRVLSGLFRVAEKLFDVQFRPAGVSAWHKDVKCFEVLADNTSIGHLLVDLYARQGKQGGARSEERRVGKEGRAGWWPDHRNRERREDIKG